MNIKERDQQRNQLEYELQYKLSNIIDNIRNQGITDISKAQGLYGNQVKEILRHYSYLSYIVGAEYSASKKNMDYFPTIIDLQNMRMITDDYYPRIWLRLSQIMHRNDTLLQKYDFVPRSELSTNYAVTSIAISLITRAIARGTVSELEQLQSATKSIRVKQAAVVGDVLVWTTQQDELVCPECSELDGQQWAMDDPELEEPPDSTHDNCRCYLDIIPAEESDLSDELDEGDIELTASEF
jgi:SPP1 gp7 family putative phage head morphogenesis protein